MRVLKHPFPPDELAVPFQKGIGLNQRERFAQCFLKPLRLCLQTSGSGDEHQLFGTGQTRLGFGFVFQNAELLPEEGNLEIFFSWRNAD